MKTGTWSCLPIWLTATVCSLERAYAWTKVTTISGFTAR
jgi:hypothetical protein